MDYAMLWVSKLVGSLLLVALVTAIASHCSKRLWQRIWVILILIFISIGLCLTVIVSGYLFFENIQPKWLFWYTLSLAVASISGSIVIIRFGLKGATPQAAAARSWPCMTLGFILTVVIVVNLAIFKYVDSKVLDNLSQVRTETTSKLQSMLPNVPDEQNARLVYELAFKTLAPEKERPKWLADLATEISKEELDGLLSKHRDTFAMIDRAVKLPHWGLQVDINQSAFVWPIPAYSSYRTLAHLLYYSALSKTIGGNTAGALQDLAMIEGMSNHLRSYPSLLSLMISIALDNVRVKGSENVLANNNRFPSGLITIPVKAHSSVLNFVHQTLVFEGAATLQGFASITGSDNRLWWGVPHEASLYRVFLLSADLKAEKKKNEILAKPVKSYEDLYQTLKTAQATTIEGGGILAKIATPSYEGFVGRSMAYEVRQGLADLALAMTASKAAKNRYPEKLEDLVPAYIDRIPTDPFDGKPLKVKAVTGGLELYGESSSPKMKFESPIPGPFNFYLGKEAYMEFRVKPEREKKLKDEETKTKAKEK